MTKLIKQLQEKIYAGKNIDKKEALSLWHCQIQELADAAQEIRTTLLGSSFDICAIINGKSGGCGEDCKFCAQSRRYNTNTKILPLLPKDVILADALQREKEGIKRYSIVTSGQKLSKKEILYLAEVYNLLKTKTNLRLCGSLGLLDYQDFRILKEAGMERCHNNLETSANFFPLICQSHKYESKIKAIKAAQNQGLTICSGGIIGMGEKPEDRIDLCLTLRELGVKSVPINILTPIKGTPLANQPPLNYEEIRRTMAVARFILPDAYLRLAGGRGSLEDKGTLLLKSGANAAISGDMLTTAGISTATDLKIIKSLGFEVNCHD